jgi:hypothetical protein
VTDTSTPEMTEAQLWRLIGAARSSGVPVISLHIGIPRLRLYCGYRPDRRDWLKQACGRPIRPEFNREEKRWEVARDHLDPLLRALIGDYGQVWLVREYNPAVVCTRSCQEARGFDCECSCQGEFHGTRAFIDPPWKDTGKFLLLHQGRRYSAALLEAAQ